MAFLFIVIVVVGKRIIVQLLITQKENGIYKYYLSMQLFGNYCYAERSCLKLFLTYYHHFIVEELHRYSKH